MGHNPQFEVIWNQRYLSLQCKDLFKLKPNVQAFPRGRIDIYIPYLAAQSIREEISAHVGTGYLVLDSTAAPEMYRMGKQTLPLIDVIKGPEVHLGIDLGECTFQGSRDNSKIKLIVVPAGELRTAGEKIQLTKRMELSLLHYENSAKALAGTLCYYATHFPEKTIKSS